MTCGKCSAVSLPVHWLYVSWMKSIFPAEVMKFSVENHFHNNHTRTRVIYQMVLLILIAGFVSLFFIRIAVNVNGRGMLKSIKERNTIKTPVSGRLEQVFVRENQRIDAGEVLFTLQADLLEKQAGYVDDRQQELAQRMGDLKQLTAIPTKGELPALELATPLYGQQYRLFKRQLAEARLVLSQVRARYDRQKRLHDQQVISHVEFETASYELENAETRRQLVCDQQVSRWQTELNQLQLELSELSAEKKRYGEERELYTIAAPVGGTIQQFNGVQPGSFMAQGETLAEISPDSGLVAEVQLLPKDIGLVRMGMPVRVHVDAFDYNQWGMLSGEVVEISDDVTMTQNLGPAYIVKCRLNQHELILANGFKGQLRKGMTFQARFRVTERTLFQLLYDKTDDWLNPNLTAKN